MSPRQQRLALAILPERDAGHLVVELPLHGGLGHDRVLLEDRHDRVVGGVVSSQVQRIHERVDLGEVLRPPPVERVTITYHELGCDDGGS